MFQKKDRIEYPRFRPRLMKIPCFTQTFLENTLIFIGFIAQFCWFLQYPTLDLELLKDRLRPL